MRCCTIKKKYNPGSVVERSHDTSNARRPISNNTGSGTPLTAMPELERKTDACVCGKMSRWRYRVLRVLREYHLRKQRLQVRAIRYNCQVCRSRVMSIRGIARFQATVLPSTSSATDKPLARVLYCAEARLVHVENNMRSIPNNFLDNVAQPLQENVYLGSSLSNLPTKAT